MRSGQPSGFETITEDPHYYVDFLDERTTIPGELVAKRTITRLLDLSPGLAVLDVGSGTGVDAIEVAKAVGVDGRVVGVDKSAAMVAEARQRAVASGVPVEFVTGDAGALEFPDASFDRVRTERMLIHVVDPEAAVRELVRVTKPGGRVVASDIDGGTMFLNSANTSLAEALALRITHGLAQGWMGRRQQRYLVEAGLVDVRVVPTVIMNSVAFTRIVCGGLLAGMIAEDTTSTDEVDAFWAELERGEREGWLCSGVTCFTVAGTKPR
ncbi:MAG TPA: methyltransferase domain-containing protein [Pseudonocardiaceae bacterium]|jgi:ubiquinone/menaquinone biosynthesis C-methylase UbiE|nr:methyltransferase domain-containing protein [Pseudonocardiaceae bacterium]